MGILKVIILATIGICMIPLFFMPLGIYLSQDFLFLRIPDNYYEKSLYTLLFDDYFQLTAVLVIAVGLITTFYMLGK